MLNKKCLVSYGEIDEVGAALQLLMQAPPEVDDADANEIAKVHYGVLTQAKTLTGERDKNFLLSLGTEKWVLKAINQHEQPSETDLQIQVLKHLAQKQCAVQTPKAIQTLDGEDVLAYGKHQMRAYTFLEGTPVNQVSMTYPLQHSFGQTTAQLLKALQDFDHPVLSRVILWDVMCLGHLENWAQEVMGKAALDQFILRFFAYFNDNVLPKLQQLPKKAIHGDLSQSNLVVDVDNQQRISGVLDFGDMVKAPRVVELGIAASYALGTNLDVMQSFEHIVAGFETESALEALEKEVLMDVIVARLVQRIVITTWRAQRFPDNAAYILRGTAHAQAVLQALLANEAVHARYVFESES